jgi:hypothetical protein
LQQAVLWIDNAAVEAKDSAVKQLNMTPAFRIPFVILISWTLLFFIYPYIAMLFIFPVVSVLFFYFAISGVRNGVTGTAYGLRGFTFERSRKPFLFWFFILFYFLWGILILGMGIFAILKNTNNLSVHYF